MGKQKHLFPAQEKHENEKSRFIEITNEITKELDQVKSLSGFIKIQEPVIRTVYTEFKDRNLLSENLDLTVNVATKLREHVIKARELVTEQIELGASISEYEAANGVTMTIVSERDDFI